MRIPTGRPSVSTWGLRGVGVVSLAVATWAYRRAAVR